MRLLLPGVLGPVRPGVVPVLGLRHVARQIARLPVGGFAAEVRNLCIRQRVTPGPCLAGVVPVTFLLPAFFA